MVDKAKRATSLLFYKQCTNNGAQMKMRSILVTILILSNFIAAAQKQKRYNAIFSGIPWFDDKGNTVSAHGANIVKDKNRYYLFGERHTDTSNAFAGFNCYSSADLYNWKFESIALPVQKAGKLGPNRVGERPKVMKCPTTGEYIMYMHVDTLGYIDQFVGYATSNSIAGPYTFKGPLLFNGKPIPKWDMGAFQDKDGLGYILLHGGDIYKLHDDYKSVAEQVSKSFTNGFESPAIFRKDSIYYFLGSNLTSWERNDNYYFTATSLAGPWTPRGIFAPTGTLTWNSQTTFVLPIAGSKDTTYMFMGDRWSFPKQASAATYVWQPLSVAGCSLSMPAYQEAWQINTSTGIASAVKWQHGSSDTILLGSSDKKDITFAATFSGKQAGLYGFARPDGGYARVVVLNRKQKILFSSIIDMYCKYPVLSLKFLTPRLPKDSYTLRVTVMGERGNWSDKKKNMYGSTGYLISLDKLVVNQ
jgi:hypothetical protein